MTLSVSIAQSGANNVTMRNKIINGNMMIDQRNAGASVSVPNNAITYATDRWLAYSNNDGACSIQQVSDAPAGFLKSFKFTTTTADSSLAATQRAMVQHRIEGLNATDLGWGTSSAQTVTLSFWVKSSLTGTFGGAIQSDPVTRAYPFIYIINSANTWEQKTITITGDQSGTWATDNTCWCRINFGMGVGSTYSGTANAWVAADLNSVTGAVSVIGTLNATWQITGVQLEKGTTATAFEQRLYGQELALCQRYYQIIRTGMGLGNTTVQVIVNSGLPVTMRATPSLSQQGVVEIGSGNADRTQSSVSTTFLNGADNSVTYLLGNYTGLTVTAPYQFRLSANTNGVTASAEL